jgi:hypothetical protein
VAGNVAPTLALTVGNAVSLGNLTAGVTKEYTATVNAVVTSTGGNATLSVSDPSTTSPGRLINGDRALARPLEASATNTAQPTSAFAPITGNTTPLALLNYAKEISLDPVTITFRQLINDTDPLRSGTYSKTLTFTLSTTMP